MISKIINWFKQTSRYKLIKREGEGHFAVIKCHHANRRMTSQPIFEFTEYYCSDCDSFFLVKE